MSEPSRPIIERTRGNTHGPITRLMSPGGLGEALKPFIFLDLFESSADGSAPQFDMHPHSGIATLTYLIDGQAHYDDTTGEHGQRGVLPTGGVEWMMAGSGVWHRGGPADGSRVLGFQLWMAMPPELELATAYSRYLASEDIARVGPARVLLGSYGGHSSPIPVPSDATYLAVHLQAGETWHFDPPPGHTVAWAAIGEGALTAPTALHKGDMVVWDDSEARISITAQADTALVLGSAVPHAHALHVGPYSVHTSSEALYHGQTGIRTRANLLRQQGRL